MIFACDKSEVFRTSLFVFYLRVSTKGQAKAGNSLEAQIMLLKDNGAEMIYADSFTGTKLERPELDKLLNEISEGDTLVVTKLDRFARSVSQASDLITSLIDKGVTVNVLNLGYWIIQASSSFTVKNRLIMHLNYWKLIHISK